MNRRQQLIWKNLLLWLTGNASSYKVLSKVQYYRSTPKHQITAPRTNHDDVTQSVGLTTRLVSLLTTLNYLVLALAPNFAWAVRSEDFVGKLQHMTIRVQPYRDLDRPELCHPRVLISAAGFVDQIIDPYDSILKSNGTLPFSQSFMITYAGTHKITVSSSGDLCLEGISQPGSDPLLAMVRNLTIITPYDIKIRDHGCETLTITSRNTFFLNQIEAIEANLNAPVDQPEREVTSSDSSIMPAQGATYHGQEEAQLMLGKLTLSAHATFMNNRGCILKSVNDGDINLNLIGRLDNHSVIEGTGLLNLRGAGHLTNHRGGRLHFKSIQNYSSIHLTNHNLIDVDELIGGIQQLINSTSGTINARDKINLLISHYQNQGQIYSSGPACLHTMHFDNREGHISGMGGTRIEVKPLDGQMGRQSAVLFNNTGGEIGSSTYKHAIIGTFATRLYLDGVNSIDALGDLIGFNIAVNTPADQDLTIRGGQLRCSQEVLFETRHLQLLDIDYGTTWMFRMMVENFWINQPTSFKINELIIPNSGKINLTHPYATSGSILIRDSAITQDADMAPVMEQHYSEQGHTGLPQGANNKATQDIVIKTTLQADGGMMIKAPQAKVTVQNPNDKARTELLLQQGDFQAWVNEFDLISGTVAARNTLIHAPQAIQIGRLEVDPNREVFAWAIRHNYYSDTHHLGKCKHEDSYTVLNQIFNQVYDGYHLIRLPFFKTSAAYLITQQVANIIGPLTVTGFLQTHDLILKSPYDSLIQSGTILVNHNLQFGGPSNLVIQRVEGSITCCYTSEDSRCKFINSESAKFWVHGEILSLFTNSIINKGSDLHFSGKSPNVAIEGINLTTNFHQEIVNGDLESRNALANKRRNMEFGFLIDIFFNPYRSSANTSMQRILKNKSGISVNPQNAKYIFDKNFIAQVQDFLKKPEGSELVRNTFPAQTSSSSAMILPVNGDRLDYNISTPTMIVKYGERGVTIGAPSRSLYDITARSAVQDLMAKGFDLNLIHVTEDVKALLEQCKRYGFKFRERFFFDQGVAEKFYDDIKDHIIAHSVLGGFYKLEGKAIFALSPQQLLSRVREAASTTLNRGYIENNQAIDLAYVQQMHVNTTQYMHDHGLTTENLHQALITTGPQALKLPTKPLIYYLALRNDQGMDELQPYVYFPQHMIDAVNKIQGHQPNPLTNGLLVFPKDFTTPQLRDHFKAYPAYMLALLERFFEENQQQVKLLDDRAHAVQHKKARALEAARLEAAAAQHQADDQAAKRHQVDLTRPSKPGSKASLEVTKAASPTPPLMAPALQPENRPQGTVTLLGNLNIPEIGIIGADGLQMTAQISTNNILLITLFGDIEAFATKQRYGNPDNYRDVIDQPMSIDAKGLIAMLSSGNLKMTGVDFYSQLGTNLLALLDVIDQPLYLESQSTHTEGKKKRRVEIRDYRLEPIPSHHESEKDVVVIGRNYHGKAPQIKANKVIIATQEHLNFDDAQRIHNHFETHTKKRGHFRGNKTTHVASTSSTSVRGLIDAKQGSYVGSVQGPIEMTNPHTKGQVRLTVDDPDGIAALRAGINYHTHSVVKKKSSVFWNSAKSVAEIHTTYTMPLFEDDVIINVGRTIVDTLTPGSVTGSTQTGSSPGMPAGGSGLRYVSKYTVVEDLSLDQQAQHMGRIIQESGVLSENILREFHDYQRQHVSGPGIATMAIVGVGIGIATAGLGTAMVGSLTPSAAINFGLAAMVDGLVIGMGTGIVAHQGDVGKALKDMGHKDQLKSLAIAGLTAGLTQSFSSSLGIPTSAEALKQPLNTFKYHLLQSSLKGALTLAMTDKSVKEVLAQGVTDVVAKTVGHVAARQIGEIRGELPFVGHKLLHGALGATLGGILNLGQGHSNSKSITTAMMTGALGAITAETVAELTAGLHDEAYQEKRLEQAYAIADLSDEQEGWSTKLLSGEMSAQDYEAHYNHAVHEILHTEYDFAANLGKMMAVGITAMANLDPSIAQFTADNALENNYKGLAMKSVLRLISIGGSVLTAYETFYEYDSVLEQTGDKEQASLAALKVLGRDVAVTIVTAGTFKGGQLGIKAIKNLTTNKNTTKIVCKIGDKSFTSFTEAFKDYRETHKFREFSYDSWKKSSGILKEVFTKINHASAKAIKKTSKNITRGVDRAHSRLWATQHKFADKLGIDQKWTRVISKKNVGVKYRRDAHTGHNEIRIMKGDINSKFVETRKTYVKIVHDGNYYDILGNRTLSNLPESHIPFEGNEELIKILSKKFYGF